VSDGQAWPAEAADGQQPTAVGTNTTDEESWRIVGEGSGTDTALTCGFPLILPGL
jgi:hypothetical protein